VALEYGQHVDAALGYTVHDPMAAEQHFTRIVSTELGTPAPRENAAAA
jgi:hypothetical protein